MEKNRHKPKQKDIFSSLWIFPTISLFIAIIIILIFSINGNNQQIIKILNIKKVPNSVHNIECESWGMTDVLTTCTFKINPKQFTLLLKGWNFLPDNIAHTFSHDDGPKMGLNFLINESYIVHPKNYLHGGHVQIATDLNRTNVIIDIYIE